MAGQAILGETLLKQANSSDVEVQREVVESLVSEHTPMVFRIAYSILRNHHDAEDAAQECFLKVFRLVQKSSAGLAQVRNQKTWLARVAWTTALDRRSRRAIVGDHELSVDAVLLSADVGEPAGGHALDQLPGNTVATDEALAERQMQQVLEKLVFGLPEDLRQPLELSTVQELNSTEIAEVMDIPESSVRTRLLRARRLLKDKMAILLEVKKHG